MIIDDSGLPDMPEGYWQTLSAEATKSPEMRRSAQTALQDNGDLLNSLVTKSLEAIDEILSIDLDDFDDIEMRMKAVSAKKDAAMGIINAGLKADENRFRRENKDLLGDLFKRIEAERSVLTIEG
jgi:hypothetical protein